MLKRIVLPTILIILAYSFWLSPNFKEIAAGVSIFLFGMLFLEEGFKAFTGGLLEKLLQRTTSNLWKSISFGIATTTVMQSSSLVSVITISFLSAGLIGLGSGIGIIFGANIGTTTGAWLVAGFGLKVNISAYAMPMLVFGVILVLQSSKTLKGMGYVLAGLGFLFLGIHYMKEGFEAFRDTVDLASFAMSGYMGLFVYTAIGLAATVIMQSSHATLVLIITALGSGQITYENGLALAIGANIGTTITAIIGSISANHQGKRLAGAHLIFNAVTGLIAIVFIHQLIWAVDGVAANVGIAHDDYTMKLAVFHTIFNAIGVAVMTPFTAKLVTFLERAIPTPKITVVEPEYLNNAVIEFPETLLEAVRNETIHLYDNAFEIMAHGLSLHRHQILSDIDLAQHTEYSREVMNFDLDQIYMTKVKTLYAAIIEFISQAQNQLPPDFANNLYELRHACGNIVQSVKEIKHLRKNMSINIVSENDDVRREYNRIRTELGQLMRTIDALRQPDGESADVLDLDDFKVRTEEQSTASINTLDSLIRERRITATAGTSLMNDLGYARNVIWNLAEMGAILFGARDSHDHAAAMLVALDEDDIDDMSTTDELAESPPPEANS
ncbi:Na/Pi symporter [Magnetovibrio sp.]|uniref:Na/Pi cotransporter family protein n=1 Tax=Magnetovibrio sp. TaxID=2024836 RepID=UPI002F9315DF